MLNEKRYFLKNANLLEEVHKSKLTYCCYEKSEYGEYDLICESYSLITPNIISQFFDKNSSRDYVIIRVMTDEHVIEYCKNGKVNLQELKMSPFKHYLIYKEDFENVFKSSENNLNKIADLNTEIAELKEIIKSNNRIIRNYQQTKNKQIPYKENNKQCREKILNIIDEIKSLSDDFSRQIMTYAKEVLRSHWVGETIESGTFDITQGKLSDGLVYMIIMLVDQYAKSGNWVGYTYLDDMKDYIIPKSMWIVGGDGFAYDIGYGGLDHVLSRTDNINILVLDTEVYSNTGGQSSKSSNLGSVASFASNGKEYYKKDLARIAMCYPHVYVACVNIGYNKEQYLRALQEANNHKGPSIIIAYAPCIAQGIIKGMKNSLQEEKEATSSGYFPLFHYSPETKVFSMDSQADFSKYQEFINGEDRYRSLNKLNKEAKEMLEENQKHAEDRYKYYQGLSNKKD